MRFERLDLTAFGPFTDLVLELGEPGVHLVYGPNEAGKTSALEATRSLLYNIPHRTTFGFLHGMPNLRLGAVLSSDGGDTLELIRHKRNKDPLTRPDGSTLQEGVLQSFLNGVPEEVFASVFTLTREELHRGGQNLIRGEGDVGQALYSARSGQDMNAVLKRLEERQKALYLRKGSLPQLNSALAELKETTAARESASTLTEDFMRLKADALEADKRFKELDDLLKNAESASRHWEALATALPSLRLRRQALAALREIDSQGPLAGSDAEKRLNALEKTLDLGDQQQHRLENTLTSHNAKLAELHVDDRLLEIREKVEALVRSVESIGEAALSLDAHTHDGREHRARAESLLRQVRPGDELGDAGVSRVPGPTAERLVELAKQYPDLRTRAADACRQVEEKDRELSRGSEALARLSEGEGEDGEGDALGAAVSEYPATLVADLGKAYEEAAKQAARFDALAAEPGWGFDIEVADLLSIAVPGREEVAAMQGRFTEHRADLKNHRAARTKAEQALRRSQNKLNALRTQEDPPTLGELQSARQERDALWVRVRAGGADAELLLDFQSALAKADGLADRLRESAEAVANRLTLENQVQEREQNLRDQEEDLDALTSLEAELAREWAALWPADGPAAPALESAGAALDRLEKLRDLHDGLGERQQSVTSLEEAALALNAQLVDLLTAAGVAVDTMDTLDVQPRTGATAIVVLPQLKALAEAELDRRRRAAQARTSAQALVDSTVKDLEKLQVEQERAEREKTSWQLEWGRVTAAAGFESGSDPEEVRSGLALLEDAADEWDKARATEKAIDREEQRIAEFDQRLVAVFDRSGRPLPQERVERARALEDLHKDTEKNHTADTKRDDLEQTIASARSELEETLAGRDRADKKLAALLDETAVSSTVELREAIDRSRDADQERERVRQAEKQLAKIGEIDDLEEQVRNLSDIEIDEQTEQARREFDEVKQERDQAHIALTQANGKLERIDSTAEAARLAEREVALAEQITDQSEEYVRVTLARKVLLERMEEYRKRHQGPILRRAEELFAFLALGEFTHLYPDLDDKGGNVLRVVRRGGQVVEIAELSEGTADQLYLALRLASLEHYDEIGQPMPLVLDDVFMTFDDQRSEAALRVLDEMSDRFQIVLFTHHAHLGRLAERALPSGRAHVHTLPRYTPPVLGSAEDTLPDTATNDAPRRHDAAERGGRICKSCGEQFAHTGRGRPPVRCPKCRE